MVRERRGRCLFRRPNLTSFSYKNCTGMPNRGYGFNILNERAQPVLLFVFERRDDAEQAHVEVRKGCRKGC